MAFTYLSGFSVDGNVGIGADIPGAKLEINDTNKAINTKGNLFVSTTDALAVDKGGQISLGGVWSGTSQIQFAGIAGRKENATSGNAGGYLQFSTTVSSGGNLTEKMRIASDGKTTITANNGTIMHLKSLGSLANSKELLFQSGGDRVIIDAKEGASPFGVTDLSFELGSIEKMRLIETGQLKLNAYDSTNLTGTPTYLLGTDASGNIVKTNTVPGSAAGPYLPLAGGTLSGTVNINASTALMMSLNRTSALGGYLRFQNNSVDKFYIGSRGVVSGGSGTGYDIYAVAGNDLRFFAGAALALTLDTSQNATFAGKVIAGSWYQGNSNTNTLWSSTSLGVYLQTPGSTASNNNSKIFFRNSGDIVKHTFDTNNGDATFTGAVYADSFDASGKILMGTDGTLSWGAAQDYGKLTYDTGKIIIRSVSGKAIEFQTNGSTEALTLDTSQNATFAGNVEINGATGITGLNGITFQNGCILDDSIGAEYLKLKYNGAAAGGLQIFDNQNTIQGYLYADGGGTSNFGLLTGSGQWGVRTTENAATSLFYGGGDKLSTTSTGVTVTGAATATTFLGDLSGTINTVTTAVTKANATNDTTVATTAFVQNLIGTIPAGLVFQGTWNASTNTPTLASGTGTTGYFYIVSVAGTTNLDGITDWEVGDWAVFVEQGASDQWEKVDNSSVLDGIGTGQTVALWSGSGTSNTLTDAPITVTATSVVFTRDIMPSAENLYDIGSAATRWEDIYGDQVYGRDFYVDEYIYHNGDTNTYIRFTADTQTFRTGGDDRLILTNSLATLSEPLLIDGVLNYTGLEIKGTGASRPAVNFTNVTQGDLGSIFGTEGNALAFATNGGAASLTLDSGLNATFAGDVLINDGYLEVQKAPAAAQQTIMIDVDCNPTGNTGSGIISLSAGSNAQAKTQIEQVTSGGSGSFGTYLDTNIINRGLSAAAHANINFITGSSTSASSIVMTIGGGTQKGNVGIGTTSPGAKLSINDNGVNVVNLQLVKTIGGSNNLTIGNTFSGGSTFALNAGITAVANGGFEVRDVDAGVARMVIQKTTGNVGIGDTSPSTKIDVYQSVVGTGVADFRHVNGNRILLNPSYNYYDAYNHIFRGLSGTSTHMTIDLSGNVGIGTTSVFSGAELDVYGDIVLMQKNWALRGNNANADFCIEELIGTGFSDTNVKLTVQSGGNVGIGTTSPGSLLHIKGETKAYITFEDTTDGTIGFVGDAAQMLTSGTFDNLGLRGEGGIQFGVSNVIKMVLDSSGNVGIGTTAPGAKLQVDGGIQMSDDTDTAVAGKVGTVRYRTSGNNSYVDMCMQTAASTYEWINIVQNNW